MESYNTVVPSSLIDFIGDTTDALKIANNNFSLKTGVILKTYDTDDKENISKIAVEYDVLAIDQQDDRGTAPVLFKKCLALESFGGIADYCETKLQSANNNEVKYDGRIDKCDGSVVLLLCITGNEDRGVIVGFLKHPARTTNLTKAAGKHHEGEFNGINWKINKDGELTITFKSSSEVKNATVKYNNETSGGTYIKMDKTGSIELSDNETEKIKIDKSAKTIDIEASKDISNKTEANFNIEASKNFDVKCKDWVLGAQGKAGLNISKDMNLQVKKSLKGEALMIDLKAKTIFKLETKILQSSADLVDLKYKIVTMTSTQVLVNAPLILLGPAPAPALTMKTKFIGVGNLGLPTISTALGPFSPSVFIAT